MARKKKPKEAPVKGKKDIKYPKQEAVKPTVPPKGSTVIVDEAVQI